MLEPASLSVAAAGDRLVLLRSPLERIGPVQLLVVDGQGQVRTHRAERIRAGFQNLPDWDRPGAYGIDHGAGLAVDPEGGRAFVVAADAAVAEVDLASLQVAYHQLRQPASLLRRLAHWLVPPAEAKQVVGSWRQAPAGWARAAGRVRRRQQGRRRHGRRAAGGAAPERAQAGRHPELDGAPLDPAATGVSWRAGRLLSVGGTWDFEARPSEGRRDPVLAGRPPVAALLGTRMVWDAQLNGDLVYADLDTGREEGRHVIVSRSGQVLASTDASMPFLLLGEEISTADAQALFSAALGVEAEPSRRPRTRPWSSRRPRRCRRLLGLVAGAVGLGRLAARVGAVEP